MNPKLPYLTLEQRCLMQALLTKQITTFDSAPYCNLGTTPYELATKLVEHDHRWLVSIPQDLIDETLVCLLFDSVERLRQKCIELNASMDNGTYRCPDCRGDACEYCRAWKNGFRLMTSQFEIYYTVANNLKQTLNDDRICTLIDKVLEAIMN